MWLYWEQIHDSMQLYVVSITDNVFLSLSIFYGYTLHQPHPESIIKPNECPLSAFSKYTGCSTRAQRPRYHLNVSVAFN